MFPFLHLGYFPMRNHLNANISVQTSSMSTLARPITDHDGRWAMLPAVGGCFPEPSMRGPPPASRRARAWMRQNALFLGKWLTCGLCP